MSYIRRLPSGKWQATVRGRDGRQHTKSDRLKSVVAAWAAQQEATPRSERRDPRAGDVKVADWHARKSAAARARPSSAKNASLWRNHCEKHWSTWRMNAITRLDAQAWADDLAAGTLSAETVHGVVHVMSGLYRAAIRETPPLVLVNPFAGLDLPVIEPRPVQFLEPGEAQALYAAAAAIDPRWRTFIELGTQVGLRFEELAGLHGHRVDWLRGRLEVVDVMTRRGLRQWPKTKRSHRTVPVPPDVLQGMSRLMAGRGRDQLVFTAPLGGPVGDCNFRDRVWYPAVVAAGIRRFAPRVMRHTAASWLVQDGVPLYDVQVLLGHESFQTTQRYAHLAPDAHSKVLESWSRRAAAGS